MSDAGPKPIRVPKKPTLDQLHEAAWAAFRDESIFGMYILEFEDPEDAKRYKAMIEQTAGAVAR